MRLHQSGEYYSEVGKHESSSTACILEKIVSLCLYTSLVETYTAIAKMGWENCNASRADVVPDSAERDWAAPQDTREASAVIWVTKHNYSGDPVLNIRGDLPCSEMHKLSSLATHQFMLFYWPCKDF